MQKHAGDGATEDRVAVMRSGRVFQAAGLLVERRFVGGVDDGRRSGWSEGFVPMSAG